MSVKASFQNLCKSVKSELNNIKSKTINGVALSSGQNLIVPRSSKSLLGTAVDIGKNGYIKFATLTVTGTYADHPHYIRLHIRNMSFTLVISGEGKNEIDVTFNKVIVARDFTSSTGNIFIYYKKVTNAVVDFYYLKSNGNDTLFVEDYIHADKYEGVRDKLEFKSEFTTTLPEGAVLIPTKADPDEIAIDVASLKAKTSDTGWKIINNLKYRISGSVVGLQGTVTPTATAMTITLGTLPIDCRPSQNLYLAQSDNDTPSRRLIINTSGVVTMLFTSSCTANKKYSYNGIFMLEK